MMCENAAFLCNVFDKHNERLIFYLCLFVLIRPSFKSCDVVLFCPQWLYAGSSYLAILCL